MKEIKEYPRYSEILEKVLFVREKLIALRDAKNVSPGESKEISTAILSDLENLVREAKINVAS